MFIVLKSRQASTLPDPDGSLSRDIASFTNSRVCQVHQAKGDRERHIFCLHQHKSFLLEEWQKMA